MAAYAAIVSLMHLLDRIQHAPAFDQHMFRMVKKQIESLRDRVTLLQHFLEDYSNARTNEIEDLEAQIADAAYAAEDVIESHIVDQIITTGHGEDQATLICQDIKMLTEKVDAIKKEAMKMNDGKGYYDQQPIKHKADDLFMKPTSSSDNNTVVGFDERSVQLMEALTCKQSNRRIISIVGMGGIGKTTLARCVYDNPFIIQYFHLRAWVTISQSYSVREILLGILHHIDVLADKKSQKDEEELAEQLYKILSGQRYLIVMDDLWSIQAWDNIKNYFPRNCGESRIILTTRLSNVADHFLPHTRYKMDFLDDDQSWNMLREKVFAQEECPPELEEIGTNIAKNCKGLPLAISVVGGVLANSIRTPEYWKYIAKNLRSFIMLENDGHCLKLLSLSYNHLPVHLKPCFLYMGMFPEDSDIRVSKLIKLWVAERFLKPIRGQTLEKAGEKYLKDLVDRNLIIVNEREYNGKPKTCSMHDMLRDLCLQEGQKERFLWVSRESSLKPEELTTHRRRFCVHENPILRTHGLDNAVRLAPRVQCSLVLRGGGWILPCDTARYELLKVLDDDDGAHSLEEVLQLVNSRYLSFYMNMNVEDIFPSSISLFWSLQTIIVKPFGNNRLLTDQIDGDDIMVLPSEIWEMSQLRHIEIKTAAISEPPDAQTSERGCVVLENLQTLLELRNFRFTKEFLEKVPNLNKLVICYDYNWSNEFWSEPDWRCLEGSSEQDSLSWCNLNYLSHLQALESLSLKVNREDFHADQLGLPHSLKKLTLSGCEIPWTHMSKIGSLPNLEVLKLKRRAFSGDKWSPIDGEFQQLKFLLIDRCELGIWIAESNHFPRLETLSIRWAFNLEEIPSGIGEIPTLRLIKLVCCKDSAVNSAEQILEDQRSLGNEDLQIQVPSTRRDKRTRNPPFIPIFKRRNSF